MIESERFKVEYTVTDVCGSDVKTMLIKDRDFTIVRMVGNVIRFEGCFLITPWFIQELQEIISICEQFKKRDRHMTYREAIQQLQDNITKAYDAAEVLRDYADLGEKQNWNEFRRYTSKAVIELSVLDNKILDNRASMPVNIDL